MEEPHGEAVATRTAPELWRRARKDAPQALAGVRMGWVLSRESIERTGCRGSSSTPKATPAASLARDAAGPRAVEDPMHVRRLSALELGDPATGHGAAEAVVRVVNPTGARRR